MLNRRSALCAGRSTIVVVVLLLGTFITFDSYTYRLFSTLSKSVPPDFFTSSVRSHETSWATETEQKNSSEVGQDVELSNIDSQVPMEDDPKIEANEPSFNEVKAPLRNTESRGERPGSSTTLGTTIWKNGDVPKQPQSGNNQTRIINDVSERNDSNDEGSSSKGVHRGTDQKYFYEPKPHIPSDTRSFNEKGAPQSDMTRYNINGSERHFVEDAGSLNDGNRSSASPIAAARTRISELSSIQKVEFDLRQARAALKRVALAEVSSAKGEGGHGHADGEPHGEAYKSAALFRQSYNEMESRLKVYIYQEGEEPLVHDGPCKEIYSVEGRFIQELQDDNPFVTSDPEEAHVFFLPFSVAMMVTYLYMQNSGDMSPLLTFVQNYVNVIAYKYPYWNRSEGADHFMLSCHDWGPYVSRTDNNLYSKSIRVLCNANTSEGFVPYKDASLPEINLVGGEVPTTLGGPPVSARTYLAFFAGADHGPVRPQLFKHWEGKDSDVIVHRHLPVAGPTYHEYMKRSKFCICPGGYEVNSPRVVEAIYNDCIPVIIADNFVLPLSDVLEWSNFSLRVLEEDIPKLKAILKVVSAETLVGMQNRVRQVQKHFLLNQPPEKYDVFHMILHSVWLRRLNIQILG